MDSQTGLLYDDIAMKSDQSFTTFIGTLATEFGTQLDWWVSGVASRNEMLSPLFHYFVSIRLYKQLMLSGVDVELVRVDSKAFAAVLQGLSFGESQPKIEYICPQNKNIRKIREAFAPFRTMVRCLGEWLTVRMSKGRSGTNACLPEGIITLIDTFVIPGNVEKERYYPGLWEQLSPTQKKRTWFVPTIHRFRLKALFSAATTLRQLKTNYLFKEDYLHLSDILSACLHYWRVRRLYVKDSVYEGVDYRPVLDEEFCSPNYFYGAVRALLNYRFVMRLRQAEVRVGRVIDWCENHAVDRGWNAGFNHYYPTATSIGYQGFHVPFQSLCITKYEYAAGVTPREIAVMGTGYVEERKKYCKELPIQVAPAFRYTGLWQTQKQCVRDRVVVALPIDKVTSGFLVNLIEGVAGHFPNVLFLIKAHPAMPLSVLDVQITAKNFKETDQPLNGCFQSAIVAICGGITTAGLEAMA
ncbi:hypothetical protein KAJ27_25820, partial [bacterium]|nr:hypothetical protein [bacterium]